MMETLNFDLAPREILVTVGESRYLLCEADEATAAAYRNAQVRGAQMADGKLTRLPEDIGGIQSVLLSGCLFESLEEKKGNPVPRGVIQTWPARIVLALFEKAKEISDLEEKKTSEQIKAEITQLQMELEKSEDTAKNLPSNTMGGSL